MKYFILFLLILPSLLFAQTEERKFNLPSPLPSNNYEREPDLLSKEFHAKKRQALRDSMPKNSVAILFAAPIRNRSNDVDYEYHQDPNFYYLTGLQESHALILIFKEEQEFDNKIKTDEIIFLQENNAQDEQWTGKRLGVNGAVQLLGISVAMPSNTFLDFNTAFGGFNEIFILGEPEDIKNTSKKDDLYSLYKAFGMKAKRAMDKINPVDLYKMMARLRQIKSEEEIVLLKKAIDITCDAQIELMKALKPDMTEYQSEAIIEFVFKNNGAEYPGFPSILGGGENSCILHYTSNRKTLTGNDLLVSDIGAEYHNYTADVTRTIPVNGKFSEEQKTIYNIVLKAQEAGINACKKGNKFWDPHTAATQIIAKELIALGIITQTHEVTTYFMHGTSHYLGLDVHDKGLNDPLEPGNVITVEPGIYIPEGSDCDPKWWNIGIRIEDDILITDDEPIILSKKVPREIEAIEKLMLEKSIFD